MLQPGLVKGPWTDDEDAVILACIAQGVTKWSDIAAQIPGRLGKQVCMCVYYMYMWTGVGGLIGVMLPSSIPCVLVCVLADHMPLRTNQPHQSRHPGHIQCRDRWVNHLGT